MPACPLYKSYSKPAATTTNLILTLPIPTLFNSTHRILKNDRFILITALYYTAICLFTNMHARSETQRVSRALLRGMAGNARDILRDPRQRKRPGGKVDEEEPGG
jgi:hypothetical protein